jgi:hypothetical protein
MDVLTDNPISARLELGTGQLYWEDVLPTGSRLELIHGPQGGYHLFGRVRFSGIVAPVRLVFRVTPLAGGAPINTPTDSVALTPGRNLLPASNGQWETPGAQLVILTTITTPTSVVQRRFVLEATVTAIESPGQSVTTSREITIVDDT